MGYSSSPQRLVSRPGWHFTGKDPHDNWLARRGNMLPNWCCTCRRGAKMVNHYLLFGSDLRDLDVHIFLVLGFYG